MLTYYMVLCFAFVYEASSTHFTTCPDSWVPYHDSCYYFHYDSLDFITAEHYCTQHNSHLVHIDDAAENAFIKNRIEHISPKTSWWIGLTDEQIEGVYKWVDIDEEMLPGAFTDWAPGQPDDYHHLEDCGLMMHGNWSGILWLWNDARCDAKFPAICELRDGQSEIVG
ncbi:C-type lectin domain family 10 member A-like [Mya arenaria]|uniref:C-type lectin domain family 10 member A-like n=1 Tax=Mya arenaria TaxID=6604 RepID=UPI0022E646FB|nr:C-type lectin domain family 10 member A-like [Mya arenaria]